MENYTLKHQFAHRTIRKFKDTPITSAQLEAILHAASQTPTYTFLQAATVIGVTDKKKQQALAEICNQHYVAEAGYLFVVVADMYRNKTIAEAKGQDTEILGSADRFLATFYDATLMTMNMVTAAESMGLGAVILGSVNNRARETIALLELPQYTFPCLGLAVGVPDQEPTLKPRMSREFMFMENRYEPMDNPLETLAAYDAEVNQYYDLRDSNNRVDTFTNQMAKAMTSVSADRQALLDILHEQGFLLR